jgi:branched-chain amino acid transport system permease protein
VIGGYASALLVIDLGAPAIISVPAAGLITAALGTLLVFPAFGLRLHYVAIATLAIGEIVSLVILNRESLTGGAMGLTGIRPLSVAMSLAIARLTGPASWRSLRSPPCGRGS